MKNSRSYFLILSTLLAILGAACSVDLSASTQGPPPTPTLYIITATLPPTQAPPPSVTSVPATITPTVPPVEGTTTTQLNVRAQPSTVAESLGLLDPFTKVQIIGKDKEGNWWMIQYPQGPNGIGWVTAQYVQTTAEPDVPVISQLPLIVASGTVAPSSPSNNAGTGTVTAQVNVRSGPGTDYDILGTLNPQDVVTLTGKDANGIWLQIEFPSGPNEHGWVSSAFVRAEGVESLPIVTEAGQIVGTGTPAPDPATVTPTLVAAPPDGDSAQSPAISVEFGPSKAQAFNYSSDVSTPEGDAEDWVQFTPYGKSGEAVKISVVLECSGNSALQVELWQKTSKLQTWSNVSCGQRSQLLLSLFAGSLYNLRLSAAPVNSGLNYVNYTVIVQAVQ